MAEKSVLHIGADLEFTDLISRVLGAAVWKVDSLNDAGEWCAALKPEHIVLLDMDMPDYPGIQVLKDIKQHSPSAHVVVLTDSNSFATVANCLAHDADFCLFKPRV